MPQIWWSVLQTPTDFLPAVSSGYWEEGRDVMTSKKASSYIQKKIKKIHAEEPDKSMKAVLGKAYGMARGEGYKISKKKSKKS